MESRDIQIVDKWDSSMSTTGILRMRLMQFCVNKKNYCDITFQKADLEEVTIRFEICTGITTTSLNGKTV